MNDHCGYHFPLHFSPEFHDFHHLKSVPETSNRSNSPTQHIQITKIWKLGFYPQNRFHTSYGWFGIWDWIHGTDDKFDKSTTHRWHFSFCNGVSEESHVMPCNFHDFHIFTSVYVPDWGISGWCQARLPASISLMLNKSDLWSGYFSTLI